MGLEGRGVAFGSDVTNLGEQKHASGTRLTRYTRVRVEQERRSPAVLNGQVVEVHLKCHCREVAGVCVVAWSRVAPVAVRWELLSWRVAQKSTPFFFVFFVFCLFVCLFFCLFVCCCKTPKHSLRLLPWDRSKTPGVYPLGPHSSSCGPTRGTPPSRDTLRANRWTEVNSPHAKLTGWLASLDLQKPHASRILSHWIASRHPPRLIPLGTNLKAYLEYWIRENCWQILIIFIYL